MTIDPDAEFTALVHRQSRFVFRVAYAVLLNSHDAEDVVQETFLKLYRSRGWEQAENERAYLARVAWREAVDLRPRRSQSSIASAEPLEADETPSPQPGPEQTLLSANQDSIIHAMIDALPEELRVPLALSALRNFVRRRSDRFSEFPRGRFARDCSAHVRFSARNSLHSRSRAMHEKDHLDRMLESALSSYGDPGADHRVELGLAERILARVSSEQSSNRSAPRWRSRFLLWAALPAAACLLLTFLLLKSAGPGDTHQSAGLPQSASTSTGSKAPGVANVTTPAPKTVPKTARTLHRTFAEVADSAARPKHDVFPLPQPLSPEEQALYRICHGS